MIYLLLLLAPLSLFSFEGWTHLELGAGNYGPDGHTQASQAMTVLLKIPDVSDAPNYIDSLEVSGRDHYRPEDQYGILFWTLDQLILRYGPTGIFHVNDLYESYAAFAAQKLQDYALSQGYNAVIIESLPGDYESLNAEETLSKYGKSKYQSIHLKNPEVSFYNDKMDGNTITATETARQNTRAMLQHLANQAEEELFLFILFYKSFVPIEEISEYMEKGIFYCPTEKWEPVPYIFPEGHEINRKYGAVFSILRAS